MHPEDGRDIIDKGAGLLLHLLNVVALQSSAVNLVMAM
jgi:hypothetical protein